MITERAKPLALQAILYFTMAKNNGMARSQAVAAFIGTELCRSFGEELTVANVYGLATAAGYDEDSGMGVAPGIRPPGSIIS